jgi:AbiV family abortive infection protein
VARQELPDLDAEQVVALQDALLANADTLVRAAMSALDLGSVDLGRSLVILAMEESAKAIALHERRVAIAYAEEGEPFVDDRLRALWRSDPAKLRLVHRFLVAQAAIAQRRAEPQRGSPMTKDMARSCQRSASESTHRAWTVDPSMADASWRQPPAVGPDIARTHGTGTSVPIQPL